MNINTTTVYQSILLATGSNVALGAIAGRNNRIKRLELFGYASWPSSTTPPTNNAGPVLYGFADTYGSVKFESLAAGAKVTIDAPSGCFLPENLVANGTTGDRIFVRALCG